MLKQKYFIAYFIVFDIFVSELKNWQLMLNKISRVRLEVHDESFIVETLKFFFKCDQNCRFYWLINQLKKIITAEIADHTD